MSLLPLLWQWPDSWDAKTATCYIKHNPIATTFLSSSTSFACCSPKAVFYLILTLQTAWRKRCFLMGVHSTQHSGTLIVVSWCEYNTNIDLSMITCISAEPAGLCWDWGPIMQSAIQINNNCTPCPKDIKLYLWRHWMIVPKLNRQETSGQTADWGPKNSRFPILTLPLICQSMGIHRCYT